MTKDFKVMNLIISKGEGSEVENLIALLTEIKTLDVKGLSFQPRMFNSEGTYFVFSSNSETAKYLLHNPQEDKSLNMSMFFESILNLDDGPHNAFYHFELLNLQGPTQADIDKWNSTP